MGADHADAVAPTIQAADAARRADMVERAAAALRNRLGFELNTLERLDRRERIDAAICGFEDRLKELNHASL
jgi:hypothetical protein